MPVRPSTRSTSSRPRTPRPPQAPRTPTLRPPGGGYQGGGTNPAPLTPPPSSPTSAGVDPNPAPPPPPPVQAAPMPPPTIQGSPPSPAQSFGTQVGQQAATVAPPSSRSWMPSFMEDAINWGGSRMGSIASNIDNGALSRSLDDYGIYDRGDTELTFGRRGGP